MNTLRDYQADLVGRTLACLASHGSAVMQLPTGGGKTRIASEILRREDGPIWFICHRQEIERQAAEAFAKAGVDFGVVSPRGKPEYDKPVQIVSVATLARRLADLPPPKLAVWDECHHVAAKSWSKIREALSGARHLGLTATPERLDGKGLASWFGSLVVGPSTHELIAGGWLSPFRYFAPSEPDLANAKLQAGDYRKSDLDKAMNMPVLIGDAIAEYRQKANGKRAIVFCASVDASKALADRFNADGIPAAHVDGATPAAERDGAVAALAEGSIKVLSNVDVFTEGFDLPAIDAVILMRPTKSLALFLQMIGRALRAAPGKGEALVFDHAGLWLEHGWPDAEMPWSLEGGARRQRLAAMRANGGHMRRCPECKEVRAEREPTCSCGFEFPTGREIGEYDGQLWELRGGAPEGCENTTNFRLRTKIHPQTIKKLMTDGMPSLDGYVIVDDALKWLEDNRVYFRGRGKPNGFISKNEFASIYCVKASCVNSWIRKGCPQDKLTRSIPVDEAMEWVRKNVSTHKAPPVTVSDPWNYEQQKYFASRLGVNIGMIERRIKIGLPCASNGWVHIRKGLEWVRDNTSIEIPPEAWPADNNNGDSSADAA